MGKISPEGGVNEIPNGGGGGGGSIAESVSMKIVVARFIHNRRRKIVWGRSRVFRCLYCWHHSIGETVNAIPARSFTSGTPRREGE